MDRSDNDLKFYRIAVWELRVLYKLVEKDYIPYSNEEAHAILNRIGQILDENELAERNSSTT